MKPLPIRGRGAAGNPPNRFEPITIERDGWTEADPLPRTRFLRDHSRSVIARNDSPDIGFNVSVNPYRGCEFGCVYCLSGDTQILMANGMPKPLREVRPGDQVYGTRKRGHNRYYVRTRVLAHWRVYRPVFRIRLADGTRLMAGADHRFLTWRGWKFVSGTDQGRDRRPHLTTNDRLLGLGRFTSEGEENEEYQRGYLCGVIRGDGHLAEYRYPRKGRSYDNQYQFRLAMTDEEALDRASDYLDTFGIQTKRFLFRVEGNGRRRIEAIRTNARSNYLRIRRLVEWPELPSRNWSKGLLAGIFDAEGSYSSGVLRIHNTDSTIIEQTKAALDRSEFDYCVETVTKNPGRTLFAIRIRGGLREHLRFFHSVQPAITRKRNFEGTSLRSAADLRVVSVEAFKTLWPLFDITTGTGDFIANGVVSHNCYARPTHEYLGFSSGLDFETKILVKENAPALLRRELSRPGWKPQVLALSSVTDPYQPIERRLGITRRVLEVLAEFRNPVAVITKSYLVTRDIDLLSELAKDRAASVSLSITTLDHDLQRAMEPRASSPERRLRAIERLAEAGIPVGVNVAPVIPGLTEHEMPAILEAAADAGATRAMYVLLRLPYGVASLFEEWLLRNFPDRKEKVLGRIREMRGGRLNDPRFRSRMKGEGVLADHIGELFAVSRRRSGLTGSNPPLSADAFRVRRRDRQLSLFSTSSG